MLGQVKCIPWEAEIEGEGEVSPTAAEPATKFCQDDTIKICNKIFSNKINNKRHEPPTVCFCVGVQTSSHIHTFMAACIVCIKRTTGL